MLLCITKFRHSIRWHKFSKTICRYDLGANARHAGRDSLSYGSESTLSSESFQTWHVYLRVRDNTLSPWDLIRAISYGWEAVLTTTAAFNRTLSGIPQEPQPVLIRSLDIASKRF